MAIQIGKTKLDPGSESAYQAWRAKEESHRGHPIESNDYDMRGYWLENGGMLADEMKPAPFVMAGIDGSSHFNDAHKLPNHPTFSEEALRSKQMGGPGPTGGHWSEESNNGYEGYYVPSIDALTDGTDVHSRQALKDYFKVAEPKVGLRMPPMDERPLTRPKKRK